MKIVNNKRLTITIVLLLTLLVSCLPMSEEQIYAKAEAIYINLEKPNKKEEKSSKLKLSDLADEQILRLSGRFINNLNPANSSLPDDKIFANQVYVGLTRQNLETLEFLPALARDWRVSEDGTVWTFNLREDLPWVRFNEETGEVEKVRDGVDNIHYVNSADLEAGLMRILSPEMNSIQKYALFSIEGANDYSMGFADEISGVNIISSTEIEITLNEPCGYLDAMAEMTAFAAYPAWPPMSYDSDDKEKILEYSYGPFVTKSYNPGQEITLIKNPYWTDIEGLRAPYLEEIRYDLSGDQDVIAQYQAGELDAVQLTVQEYDTVREDPILSKDIHVSPGPCGYYLVFKNIDDPTFSSVVLRQAIAAGIDKETLASKMDKGTAEVLDQYVPDHIRGASDYAIDIGIAYDPVSAESEIKNADLEIDDLGTITLLVPETDAFTLIANNIEPDIQKVLGNDIVASYLSEAEFYETVWKPGEGTFMYIIKNCLDFADAHSLWSIWHPEGLFSGLADGDWQESDFRELLLNGASSHATSQRQMSYASAEDIIINQDTIIVPLVSNSQQWLINPKLSTELSPLFPHLENWAFVK